MQTWAVQDAKSRFSEFLDACLAKGPQVVTRRGTETAVLVPVDVWKKLQNLVVFTFWINEFELWIVGIIFSGISGYQIKLRNGSMCPNKEIR